MKQIIIGSIVAASTLFADIVTVMPYGGTINYDGDPQKSIKDKATIFGAYASVGNLEYLLEANFSHLNTKYKYSSIPDLNQNDITISYGKYYKNFMFRIGDHYVSTSDNQLGDGNIVMATLGGYFWDGSSKFSYGLEGYYSNYSNGHDEAFIKKSIAITQFTPYLAYHTEINERLKNTLTLKLNYQIAPDYIQDRYSSFEISDTVAYDSFYATLKYFNGEMRSGVIDSGMLVFNTLDLVKSGFDLKLGYHITREAAVTLSYGRNNYQEYDELNTSLREEGSSSVILASFSYRF